LRLLFYGDNLMRLVDPDWVEMPYNSYFDLYWKSLAWRVYL